MEVLVQIILASFLVSLVSLSGAILFIIKEAQVQKYMILFVALAAGSLLGGAFFHLIPESYSLFSKINSNFSIPAYFILLGIFVMYIIEKFLHWHHHHDLGCKKHILSSLSLIGGGFHRLVDGVLIGSVFLVDVKLGIIVTILIIFHKIPQEIGNIAILLHSKYSKFKALFLNYLSSSATILGSILGYIFFQSIDNALPLILSFTAGGFIYIALADIIPELHKKNVNIFLINLFLVLGVLISFLFTLIG